MKVTGSPASDDLAAAAASTRVAVLRGPGRFDLIAGPRPTPGRDQVRIAIEGCGICGSDLPPWRGGDGFAYPFEPGAPGHEPWGVVDAVGERVSGFAAGDRVVALGYHAFAEYDVAGMEAVVSVPDSLKDTAIPGEPIACAMNVLDRAGVSADMNVVIIGIGFLGALLTRLASAAGARVIAVSRRSFAREIAREMGAAHTVAFTGDPTTAAAGILKEVDGDGAACVIEAVGRQDTLDLATEVVGTRGRLVIAGYHQDGPRRVDMQRWNWRGLDVINAHERDPAAYVTGMRRAVAALAEGRIPLDRLITHRFGLDELDAAMRMQQERPDGYLKGIVTP